MKTEPVLPSVGVEDVGGCEDVRASSFDTFAYDLTVTNDSDEVAAIYTMAVALRDADGVRRLSRLVLADDAEDGAWNPVEPGATVTETDEALVLPYPEGWTCEVVAVDKRTEGDFFTVDDGTPTGSLNSDIAFASGSAELTRDAEVLLQSAVERLQTETGPVCVAGFADSVGDAEANLRLSQERADAVADYLREAQVPSQIEAAGRGEGEAQADNVDDPDLRRVDITLAACSA
ncbi:MAG: OmpA family protein [Propioniciclava sp.]